MVTISKYLTPFFSVLLCIFLVPQKHWFFLRKFSLNESMHIVDLLLTTATLYLKTILEMLRFIMSLQTQSAIITIT